MDILFIQPWDRPWDDSGYVARRRKMYLSRAQFEVGVQVPDKYSFGHLDLNLEVRAGKSVEDAVAEAVAEYRPRLVMLTMPVYVLGGQIGRIIGAIEKSVQAPPIILGGGEIALIHDLPLRLWPQITCCYNGFGAELPELIEACLSRRHPKIAGVYWRGESHRGTTRGAAFLIDGYSAEDFYTACGRLNFDQYLARIRAQNVQPMGIVEMTRGCSFRCDFCAINGARMGFHVRSPQTVVNEMRFLAERGIDYLHIIDPTFGLDREAACALLQELAHFHAEQPAVGIEILTRPELVTEPYADALKRAGIRRCAIGMETMEKQDLGGVHKTLCPSKTEQAVYRLALRGIQTKLFHIVFPNRFSEATIAFFSELSQDGVPFVIQTSFLRQLPDRLSAHPFITQDQTVYVPRKDTPEQLMEWMLANQAFPSMDLGDRGDAVLRKAIRTAMKRGKPLESLFSAKREKREWTLRSGWGERYRYVHRGGFSVAQNMN
ncbi:MAG: radical SAM protein [Candidatus Niyogibacteria bacterium]|nr:radical SAM protein [Candidatus Niyogibacteria bacterium]